MTADEYNRPKIQSGEIALDDIIELARYAQNGLGEVVDGKIGPKTLMRLTRYLISVRPATGEDLARMARAQVRDQYEFGAEVDLTDPNPVRFDCSELVEWCCTQIGVAIVDGSWRQYQVCHQANTVTGIGSAIDRTGSLLFKFVGDPLGTQRPQSAHVAISLGNGLVVEARRASIGVEIASSMNRGWTHAGFVPGLVY